MACVTESIIIHTKFDINNNEVEYICKFNDKYHQCISKNQSYIEHLVRRIDLMEYILHDFETSKHNIIENALLCDCDDEDEYFNGITYWNQKINPTEPIFTEMFDDVKDILFGEYTQHDFICHHDQQPSTSELRKKERRIMELKSYFRNFADLRLFEEEE
jgi:hypothetical protein